MMLRTRPPDSPAVAVADTSVVINIIASKYAAEIIAAFPHRVVIINAAADELVGGRSKGRDDADILDKLIAAGLIEVVSLGEVGLAHFESLVVGSASETLDDGEAATLAHAVEIGAVAIIDERKANRISGARFPGLAMRCSLDVFANAAVQQALCQQRLAEAVFNALRGARMRVPLQHRQWVVDLIGTERAAVCSSLPDSVRTTLLMRQADE